MIKKLIEILRVVFTINRVSVWCLYNQKAFYIPGSKKTVLCQTADTHIEKFFFGSRPHHTVPQTRYLQHEDIITLRAGGRAELIHVRNTIIRPVQHIDIAAVKNILFFRNHPQCYKRTIIQPFG